MATKIEIVRLILLSKKQSLTNEETVILKKWIDETAENEAEYHRLSKLFDGNELVELYKGIDTQNAKEKVFRKISRTNIPSTSFSFNRKWIAVAAIIPFAMFLLFFLKPNNEKQILSYNDIKPGSAKAILEVGRGEKIILPNDANRQIYNENGEMLGLSFNNTFVCNKIKSIRSDINTLHIPTGGEYKLVLCDGTKISVNSESKIQYPFSFEKDKRRVKLMGEAYFEVAKNEKLPFEISTKNAVITVLGTKFNVCNYDNEQFEQITLEEGAIEVKYKDQFFKLTPGMQLIIDSKNKKASVKNVDTNLYVSWKDDLFRFQDMNLDELTKKIQRWYNVKFVFKDQECKSYRFTGALAKDANFNDFITLIESTTEVKFALKENKINISKK